MPPRDASDNVMNVSNVAMNDNAMTPILPGWLFASAAMDNSGPPMNAARMVTLRVRRWVVMSMSDCSMHNAHMRPYANSSHEKVNWLSSCAAIAAAVIPVGIMGSLFIEPSSLMVRCARFARRVPIIKPIIAVSANANELMGYS